MRLSSRLCGVVAVAFLILAGAVGSLAQTDPGNPDSVIIDLQGAKRWDNDSIHVNVVVNNDEAVQAGTIPA